jgi:hypothetical protein
MAPSQEETRSFGVFEAQTLIGAALRGGRKE